MDTPTPACISWEPVVVPTLFERAFPAGLLECTRSGQVLIAGGSVMAMGRAMLCAHADDAARFVTDPTHMADVDVFVLGPRGADAVKAYLMGVEGAAVVCEAHTAPGTFAVITPESAAVAPGRSLQHYPVQVQVVFGTFGCTQDEVLLNFDVDVVSAGLRINSDTGAVELGTRPTTRAAWQSGVATVFNGTVLNAGRFPKLYAKGFTSVGFADGTVEAAARVHLTGPDTLLSGPVTGMLSAVFPKAGLTAALVCESEEKAVALFTEQRQKWAAAVAAARAMRENLFRAVVGGKLLEFLAAHPVLATQCRALRAKAAQQRQPADMTGNVFSATDTDRVNRAWMDGLGRGVLAAASRRTVSDAFYGQTFVRDVAAASERVRTFLGTGPGMEAVADSVVAFFESVAATNKACGAASAAAERAPAKEAGTPVGGSGCCAAAV